MQRGEVMEALKIDWLSGTCPVQAEGTIDGLPFYFRARHDSWTFTVAATADGNPVEVWNDPTKGYHYKENYGEPGGFDAGYMPHEEARQFIEQAADLYLREKQHPLPKKLYPFGYGGSGKAKQLDALMAEHPDMWIVDIRKSPRSANPAWNYGALRKKWGKRYVWLGQWLGNRNYNIPGADIELVDAAGGMMRLCNILKHRSVCLLCGCAEYEGCHRKDVTELAIQELPGLEVVL
jgi:hypothetical protein